MIKFISDRVQFTLSDGINLRVGFFKFLFVAFINFVINFIYKIHISTIHQIYLYHYPFLYQSQRSSGLSFA